MIRLPLLALAAALATPTFAQTPDPHAGHVMPVPAPAAADPHAGHAMPAAPAAADPHAGHAMPAEPATADPHAGHDMSAMTEDLRTGADLPVGEAPPPPIPSDHAADGVYGAATMAASRDVLAGEHGRVRFSKAMIDQLELRPAGGGDGYAWSGEFRYGGDIDRLALKTEGEGETGGALETGEAQALYSRAVGPYFDLQAGVRQDFASGPDRTYAVLAVEGLAPYWYEVEGSLFLSLKGELFARLEASHDLRLTQRLILEPRGELELAAQDSPSLGLGAGVTGAELGLRLRYEVRREFAPYLGLHYERKLGETARFARAAGDDLTDVRFVVGLRAWF